MICSSCTRAGAHILCSTYIISRASQIKKICQLSIQCLKRSWLRGLDIFTSMMEVHSSVTSKSQPHISWLQNWWQSGVFFYFLYSMLDFLLPILIFLLHTNMVSYYGPTQVKSRLLISSIFYVMNFRHFLEIREFNLWHFWKMSEIHCIKNARN